MVNQKLVNFDKCIVYMEGYNDSMLIYFDELECVFDMRLYFSVVHVFVVDIVMNKYVNVM